jgi:magnesium transporter
MGVTARPSEEVLRLWPALASEEKLARFRALPSTAARDLFRMLETPDQADLLRSLTPSERGLWLNTLPLDDAADLIQRLPTEERREVLEALDITTRREMIALLAYAEDAAGGLMNPRFARLRPEMTVDEGISYLRRQADDVDGIYYGYVIDPDQRLLGVVSFRQLFSAERSRLIREVMHMDLISVREGTDQEEIAKLFSKHHFLAIPVVDSDGHMKGVVSVDDIVEVVEEEASAEI